MGQPPSNPADPATVRVELGERSYNVLIGRAILEQLGLTARARCRPGASRAFLVVDANLPKEPVAHATASLTRAGFATTHAVQHASEPEKSIPSVETLLTQIAETRHERQDVVIALGGGIVGDLAGFVAGIYRRGVPFIQCPTTLLSMVDASVGGKTGANLTLSASGAGSLKKNLIGVFHQPVAVLADLATLDSLADREFRAGLAECVKHGLISADFADPDLFAWMETTAARILARDPAVLKELVHRNVAVKARVVAGDEREEAESAAGGRALLNLGHTFGHALEPIPTLSPDSNPARAPLLHGEAIALGLVAACATAGSLGLCGPDIGERARALLQRFGLPVRVAGLPDDAAILAAMAHDKKVMGGRLRLVLPARLGHAKVVESPDESAIRAGLGAIRAG